MARLAIFIPDLRGGGAERTALTLAEGFINRGHEVELVLLRAAGELMDAVPPKARIIELKANRIRETIRPLVTYLRHERPDALLAVMWPLTVVAVLARIVSKAETKIVVSDHGILSEHYARRPAILAALRLSTRLLYPRADARMAASQGIAADLAKLSGIPNDTIQVIHNPIAVPIEQIGDDKLAKPLWGDAKSRILAVGALKPEKDYGLLIEAFATLPRERNAGLMIVGEGQLRPQLEGLADRLGVGDRVSLPSFRDPWPYYVSADLFVLSSRSEGFGNVLVEALAAGLPIVSTDCPGPREILEGGKWGALVPAGDRDSLAEAMEQALDRSVDKQGLKARSAQFGPDIALDAYLAVLLGQTQSEDTAR